MAGELEFELEPGDLKRILGAAKKANPELAKALRKRLRGIGLEIVAKIKSEVMERPPTGGRSPGRHTTRKQIAAGLGVKVATAAKKEGVFVTASSARLPESRRPMMRLYNKPTWRHPVFGSNTWVIQKGHPYFGRSIKPFEPKAEIEIREALEDMIRQIKID